MATRLAAEEIAKLDPYKFMAVIGKRVIHPGGRASTSALLNRAHITADSRVLDVGCGVATTAVEIARHYGAGDRGRHRPGDAGAGRRQCHRRRCRRSSGSDRR